MITISKEFHFSAAHRLPRHSGQCSRPHGHNYKFGVWIKGNLAMSECSGQGMVFDYGELKALVDEHIVSKLDHQDLNKAIPANWPCRLDPEVDNVTTAEVLAWLFAATIQRHLPPFLEVAQLTVKETESTSAIYTPSFEEAEERLTREMDKIFEVAVMV